MGENHFSRRASFVLVLMALVSAAMAQTYTVTDLGVLPGDSASQGFSVNSSGQVVGCADTSAIGAYPCSTSFPGHAFLWTSDTGMQDLGVLNSGDIFSMALSINDSGQVTGLSENSSGSSAPFLWTQSTGMIALPTLPGATYSFAGEANARGEIFGTVNSGANPGLILPVAWTKSGSTYKARILPTLPGASISLCCSLNNNNQGAGVAFFGSTGTSYHGFLVTLTTVKDLGTLPGGTISNANWINSSGVIAGYSTSSTSGSNWNAVIWDATGKIHSLGTLPGGNTSAGNGINDSNQVIGFANTATSASDAILWTQKGGLKDLNKLIPPNSGWILIVADSINNSGQITGYGTLNGENHAFLLTP